ARPSGSAASDRLVRRPRARGQAAPRRRPQDAETGGVAASWSPPSISQFVARIERKRNAGKTFSTAGSLPDFANAQSGLLRCRLLLALRQAIAEMRQDLLRNRSHIRARHVVG